MAEKKIYMGSMGPFLVDDSDTVDDSDGDWSGETHVGFRTDSQMVATEFVGIPISSISVSDIDNPSTELNPLSASTVGGLIAVYEAVGSADDEFTMYLWDTDAAAENVPYTVDGSGGTWVAVGGKYFNGDMYVEGDVNYGGSLGPHTIASHSDTSVTGAELTTVEGRVDQDLKVAASPSFTGLTKIGTGANYASFAADGELTLAGTARVEQFVESLVPTGKGGSAPDERTSEEPYLSWTFEVGEDSHQTFEAPYSMDYTDTCKVKIHWYTSVDQTDDEVQWRATWNAIPEAGGEVMNGGGTQIDSGDVLCPTQWHIKETLIGTIAGNSIAQDDIIGLSFERIAIDDGTNPANDSIHVLSLEFEYYLVRLGEAT